MSTDLFLFFLFLTSFLLSSSCSFPLTPPFRHRHRHLSLIPTPPPTAISYHGGPLLTSPSPIRLYFIWCGAFSPPQKSILTDFASSFSADKAPAPSVATWWSIAKSYRDKRGVSVSAKVLLVQEANATVGTQQNGARSLQRDDIAKMVKEKVEKKELPEDRNGVYVVLTGEEVVVEGFCMSVCGFHGWVDIVDGRADSSPNVKLAIAWVGNPAVQCPGFCAWPFARADYGPATPPLLPPNSDAGVDGMIISLATVLAGAATNPRETGFYEGDPAAPLEAVSACAGIFGRNGRPGELGSLLVDGKTGASYNAHGANGRTFLLPAMWSPSSKRCESLPV